MCEKHGPIVKNLGDDGVTHMYYKKHDSVVGNLEDVDVIHVDLRETLSGREKPRGRPLNTHGFTKTFSGH